VLRGTGIAALELKSAVSTLPEHCVNRLVVRTRFCETDLMGIVHHGTHLQYFEAGRIEYLRRRGLNYARLTERGVHLPVVEAVVRYRRAIRFDQLVVVETRLVELGRVKVGFEYRIVDAEDIETVLAEGRTLLACVDAQHVPRKLPDDASAALVALETDRDQ
jgi:acyl-CoA thioester hydrolase